MSSDGKILVFMFTDFTAGVGDKILIGIYYPDTDSISNIFQVDPPGGISDNKNVLKSLKFATDSSTSTYMGVFFTARLT
jgi:hypothetical protein